MQYGALVDLPRTAERPTQRDAWPLPAIAAWGAAWLVFGSLKALEAPPVAGLACAVATGVALSAIGATRWRRLFIAGGFPLSLIATGGAAGLPAWAWLLPLALLALAYPLGAWRDAPFFPTPRNALDGLDKLAPLPATASVLDAGCGLGHGLSALRRAYPKATLQGTERSLPLALLARWNAARVAASVQRGDMWADDWSAHAMVYLFQRPETLPRAVAKARSELPSGGWLASLEFPAVDLQPQAVLDCADGRKVWLYRIPFVQAAADNEVRPSLD